MPVIVGIVVALLLLAFSPIVLPIAGLVWGVKTLRSAEHAGNPRRRGFAVVSVVGSLVFAGVVWPALGGGSGGEEVEAEPASAVAPVAPVATSAAPQVTAPTTHPTPPAPTADDATEPPAADPLMSDSSSSDSVEPTNEGLGAAAALVPVAGIVDGDTITVRIDGRTERVRVIGIDTPELADRECYAQQAASRMQSLAQSRSVRLEADPTQADRDRYGRLLRHVFVEDGRSAAQILISEGLGREYTYAADYRYQGRYRAAEAAARSAGKGLWGSGCSDVVAAPAPASAPGGARSNAPQRADSTPRAFAPRATPKSTAKAETGRCTIKGNISSKGEKIYHVPGGRSYDKTVITESKGERWFCSASDAEAAGWRAARG